MWIVDFGFSPRISDKSSCRTLSLSPAIDSPLIGARRQEELDLALRKGTVSARGSIIAGTVKFSANTTFDSVPGFFSSVTPSASYYWGAGGIWQELNGM